MSFHENSAVPYFNDCVKSGECPDKLGIVAYYSNRCPYTDYYVNGVLRVLAQEINIPLKVIKLETREQAQTLLHQLLYFLFLQWEVCNYGFKYLY